MFIFDTIAVTYVVVPLVNSKAPLKLFQYLLLVSKDRPDLLNSVHHECLFTNHFTTYI
jgi:hypothetical protein